MSPSLAVLDRIALYAIMVDREGRIRFQNAALRDASTLADGDLFSSTDVPDGLKLVRAARSDSEGQFTTAIALGGQTRLVEWSPSPFPDGEILYIGKDVTRDRRSYANLREIARSAADASQSKMRFLATMSHEMRTPLNGILGMNGLLLDTDLDANQRTYAEAVRQSGIALLGLINDILDYSKIEAGHLELEEHWFDPASLLQGVTELLSPRAAEKGLEIAACIAPDVPTRLYGDEGRLRQVLLNLAGNGVKFTEQGGVSLELSAKPGARPDVSEVRFLVRDTGVGIAPDHLATIFKEFAQVDDGRTKSNEGTGLGLAIAQQIIAAMGSKIRVDSEPAKGSLFSFTLTMNSADETDSAPRADYSDLTLVVATDQPFLQQVLAQQLETVRVGTILFASTGDEAMRHLSRNPHATLLCDLSIAAAEGSKLAEASPHAIVLLSPLARGRLDAFRQAGFDGYLIKPIRQESLAERLACTDRQDEKCCAPADRLDTVEVKRAPTSERRLRILLAEDNQINSVLAQAILKRAGHHVDVAANGIEAVDTFALAPYDVVLMDMRMPLMDGLEASRRIRETGSEVPIIALTANASSSDRDECFEAGMNDFVSKPIEPNVLTDIIDRWVAEDPADASSRATTQAS